MDRTPGIGGKTNTPQPERFICGECNASFTHAWSLTRHDQTKHWKSSYSCGCLKMFSRKDHLLRHKATCTGLIKVGTIMNTFNFGLKQDPILKNLPTTKDFKFKRGDSLRIAHEASGKKHKKITAWKPYKSVNPPKQDEYKTCPISGRLVFPKVFSPIPLPVSNTHTAPATVSKASPAPPSSSPIPSTSTKEDANRDLIEDLFGHISPVSIADADVDEPLQIHADMGSITNDLLLSSDSEMSLDLSFTMTPDETQTLAPKVTTPVQSVVDVSLQQNLLKVIADLTTIQGLSQIECNTDMHSISLILEEFHTKLQPKISALLQ